MTELGQMPGDARKRKAENDVVSVQIGGTKFVPEGSPPTVPRVARSVDDLRVGMVVAWRSRLSPEDHGWCLAEVTRPSDWKVGDNGLVILSDPPARDWLVPATQMEALREALREDDDKYMSPHEALTAARAVLDAAREVEHE